MTHWEVKERNDKILKSFQRYFNDVLDRRSRPLWQCVWIVTFWLYLQSYCIFSTSIFLDKKLQTFSINLLAFYNSWCGFSLCLSLSLSLCLCLSFSLSLSFFSLFLLSLFSFFPCTCWNKVIKAVVAWILCYSKTVYALNKIKCFKTWVTTENAEYLSNIYKVFNIVIATHRPYRNVDISDSIIMLIKCLKSYFIFSLCNFYSSLHLVLFLMGFLIILSIFVTTLTGSITSIILASVSNSVSKLFGTNWDEMVH